MYLFACCKQRQAPVRSSAIWYLQALLIGFMFCCGS